MSHKVPRLVLIIIVGCIILTQFPSVSGGTIIVDDDVGDWADYQRIQDAVNNSKENDIIRVYDGNYYEDVIVNQSVKIIGNGSNKSSIVNIDSEEIFRVESKRVDISGFTINAQTADIGIVIRGNETDITQNHMINAGIECWSENMILSSICISDNTFTNSSLPAISIEQGGIITIMNNYFQNCSSGIYLMDVQECSLENNILNGSPSYGDNSIHHKAIILTQMVIQSF